MPDTTRLFLGLWPTSTAVQALQAWQARYANPTPPDRLHVTLHFLGEVPNSRLEAVADGLAVTAETFDLVFDRLMHWHGGLGVLVPTSPPEQLLHLHAALQQRLPPLDLPVEQRPYRPHVTLTRQATGAATPYVKLPPAQWTATSYTLVASQEGHYHLLREYPLAPRHAAAADVADSASQP